MSPLLQFNGHLRDDAGQSYTPTILRCGSCGRETFESRTENTVCVNVACRRVLVEVVCRL